MGKNTVTFSGCAARFLYSFLSQRLLPPDANSNSGEGMTGRGRAVEWGGWEGGCDSISGASCGKCKIMRKGFVCIN